MRFDEDNGTLFGTIKISVEEKGFLGMQEVTFDLQTITPLFMAGADQATAELRAPSFRKSKGKCSDQILGV